MVVSFMVAIPFSLGLIMVRLDRTAAPNSSVNGTQSDFRCGTGRRRGPPGKSHAMAAKRGYGLSNAPALLLASFATALEALPQPALRTCLPREGGPWTGG